jgi:hypothetical protein
VRSDARLRRAHLSLGQKVFVAQVRVGKSIRRVKIGLFGPYTVDKARERAEAMIRTALEGVTRNERSGKRATRRPLRIV